MDNDSQKNSNQSQQNYRGRIQFSKMERPSWGSNPFEIENRGSDQGEQLFDNLLNARDSSIIYSREQSQFDVFSRPSGRHSNVGFRPLQKNSDLLGQRDSIDSFVVGGGQDTFISNRASLMSNRGSNNRMSVDQITRMSVEGVNHDSSLEIVMEWGDQEGDQNELQFMISNLNIQSENQVNMRPDRQSILPSKNQGCICTKTQCLKLYCQCFHNGKLCQESCECTGCLNDGGHIVQIEMAKRLRNDKNPSAFGKEVEKLEQKVILLKYTIRNSDLTLIIYNILFTPTIFKVLIKSCNCKKSKCIKKYCECFNSGQACNKNCNCDSCLNSNNLHESKKLSDSIELELPGIQVHKQIKT